MLDVLFHLPYATLDRRARPKIRDAVPDTLVTLEVRVVEHRSRRPRARTRRSRCWSRTTPATSSSSSSSPMSNGCAKRLPIGATRWISGKLELWDGHLQMVHPDRVMDREEFARHAAVEPVYGLTEGLYPRTVAARGRGRAEAAAEAAGMDRGRDARGAEPAGLRRGAGRAAPAEVAGRHRADAPALTRLAYDELLANQLALLLVRARMRAVAGRAASRRGTLEGADRKALPFALTGAQSASDRRDPRRSARPKSA